MRALKTTMLAAALLATAAHAESAVTIAASAPGKPIALGDQITVTDLIFRKVPHASQVHRCFVVVDGLSATRPVGTQYELSFTLRGMDVLPNQTVRAGVISFYEAAGSPPVTGAPLSFEIPVLYCTHDAWLNIKPLGKPNLGAKPTIGSISLIGR
jgi:hypothetical protein